MAKRKHQSGYRKATDALEQEGRKQCFIIYGASAIALWRHYGKRQRKRRDFYYHVGKHHL